MHRLLWVLVVLISIVSSTSLKRQNHLFQGVERYRLIVKISDSVLIDFEQDKPSFYITLLSSLSEEDIHFFNQFTYHQVVSYTDDDHATMKTGIVEVSEDTFDIYSLRGMAYVEEASLMDKMDVLHLAESFESYSFVEYAALEPFDPIEPPTMNKPLDIQGADDVAFHAIPSNHTRNTPDYEHLQLYKRGKTTEGNITIFGIDSDYSTSLNITGRGIKVADIEWGFDYKHEDLESDKFIELIETTRHESDDHGTAVAGVLISKDNGFGVTGTVPDVDVFYGISEITRGRVAGITEGLKKLSPGDVFIYEMQTFGHGNRYVPADYNQAVWDITKKATSSGIIVVAAAGNGNVNLDDIEYTSYRNRGDNGAIIVGASTKLGLNKASFSTYGSPVHVNGWGDWTVVTSGYGELIDLGKHRTYTSRFSGTSSATPIVSSAVIAVQSYVRTHHKIFLKPNQMRELLIQTGTPQGNGGHIGPLPNIRRAIETIKQELSK